MHQGPQGVIPPTGSNDVYSLKLIVIYNNAESDMRAVQMSDCVIVLPESKWDKAKLWIVSWFFGDYGCTPLAGDLHYGLQINTKKIY